MFHHAHKMHVRCIFGPLCCSSLPAMQTMHCLLQDFLASTQQSHACFELPIIIANPCPLQQHNSFIHYTVPCCHIASLEITASGLVHTWHLQCYHEPNTTSLVNGRPRQPYLLFDMH